MRRHCFIMLLLLTAIAAGPAAEPAAARTLLKNICRVKGLEENTLRGLGLVVGLKGTGDGGTNLPTMRALARAMELMGNPISRPDLKGRGGLAELKETKNVALVWVTATVPSTGGRSGDKVDCYVSGIGAKSLSGGRLVFAALQGPDLTDPRVYAFAEGRIQLDDLKAPLEGKIYDGCRLEEDIFNDFQKEGRITLVLDKNHADFQVSSEIAQSINAQLGYQGSRNQNEDLAKAIDPANIVVAIPDAYRAVPVQFVAQVMDLPVFELNTDARVVINERAGSIVISGDVEIGPVVVTHKNITVDTTIIATLPQFVAIDPAKAETARLKSLLEALNSVKAPTTDVIEIIKGIERNGKLHARLIIE